VLAVVVVQPQGHDGLEADAEGRGIHPGVSALDHTFRFQPLHPGVAGGGRQIQRCRHLLVGHLDIFLKKAQQLEINPGDWFIRSHLAGLLEAQGDLHGAAEVILAAPAMPVAADHMLAAVRILTPVNPAAALPYLQL
jgi:hypothetical protein